MILSRMNIQHATLLLYVFDELKCLLYCIVGTAIFCVYVFISKYTLLKFRILWKANSGYMLILVVSRLLCRIYWVCRMTCINQDPVGFLTLICFTQNTFFQGNVWHLWTNRRKLPWRPKFGSTPDILSFALILINTNNLPYRHWSVESTDQLTLKCFQLATQIRYY